MINEETEKKSNDDNKKREKITGRRRGRRKRKSVEVERDATQSTTYPSTYPPPFPRSPLLPFSLSPPLHLHVQNATSHTRIFRCTYPTCMFFYVLRAIASMVCATRHCKADAGHGRASDAHVWRCANGRCQRRPCDSSCLTLLIIPSPTPLFPSPLSSLPFSSRPSPPAPPHPSSLLLPPPCPPYPLPPPHALEVTPWRVTCAHALLCLRTKQLLQLPWCHVDW